MEKDKNNNCLSDEEIGALAVRLGAREWESAPGEGQPAPLLDYLLLSVDNKVREHLTHCESCKGRLLSEIRIIHTFSKPIDTRKADIGILRRIETDIRVSLGNRRYKLLFYSIQEQIGEDRLALAAATSSTDGMPIIFAEREDEGDMILKQERDPLTGELVYYLISGDIDFYKNA
ncbi:MAG: hypothetical protein KAX38_09720, partial [Candidatus Krumholzibacteria bacterium]|nr:hypothetical protein [Candidatus Krumholzibacteria bacterium]